jgi:dTDP-4-dehydrorhamnose 3,5-epimerase
MGTSERAGMEFVKTELDGVILVRHEAFEDHRGEFVEIYNEKIFAANGVTCRFVQDDVSVSTRNVLRGLHGDTETTKLVTCLVGRIYLVIVDCREGSPTFGKWIAHTLTEKNRHQFFVPPGFGMGHVALSDRVVFHYKQSAYYNPKGQFTCRWDDPRFGIWWPIKNPILSPRDERGGYA